MSTLTIVSFNIGNAVGDERNEDYRFGKRLDKICQLLQVHQPDVVMLQEIRTCRNPEGNALMTPYEIAFEIAKQTNLSVAGLFTLNPSELAFSRLTLYNPETVFPLQCFGE